MWTIKKKKKNSTRGRFAHVARCAKVSKMNSRSLVHVVCVYFLHLLPLRVVPYRQPMRSGASQFLGNCERFNLDLLGDTSQQFSGGLIAQHLLYETQNIYSQPEVMDLPDVQVLEAAITCESLGTRRGKSSSVSVLARYSCMGQACSQDNSSDDTILTQLFSFQCDTTDMYTVWTGSYLTDTNRTVNYTISSATVTELQCALCVVSENFKNSMRYIEEAGCLGRPVIVEVVVKELW